jgi:hypothetical protein
MRVGADLPTRTHQATTLFDRVGDVITQCKFFTQCRCMYGDSCQNLQPVVMMVARTVDRLREKKEQELKPDSSYFTPMIKSLALDTVDEKKSALPCNMGFIADLVMRR